MTNLSIEAKQISSEICLLKVAGDLDAASYEQMEAKLQQLFKQGCYKLICNLEGLSYISSAGAGVFLSAVDTTEENNGNIVMLKPSKEVQEVFEILGLSEIFPSAQTLEQALELFENPPSEL
jgi:anti-sigma B factor antagonist